MLKKTEAISCFVLFSHRFYYRSYGIYDIVVRLIKFNSKFRTN